MEELMDMYLEKFKKTFPSYQLMSLGEERVKDIIRECLDTGKTPYELGYLKRGDGIKY